MPRTPSPPALPRPTPGDPADDRAAEAFGPVLGAAGTPATNGASGPNDATDEPDEDAGPGGFSKAAVFWSVALSLAATALISFFTRLDVTDLALFWNRLNGGLMALALLMLGLRIAFGTWRLQHLSNGRLGLRHAFRGQLAWDFFSNVTPAAVGGGPFAAAYVARDRGISVGEGAAILLFAMLIDQFWTATSALVVLVALLFVPVLPASLGVPGVVAVALYFVCTLAWTVLFAGALLYRPEWLDRALALVLRLPFLRRFEDRARREVARLHEHNETLRDRGAGFYAKGYALTAGAWLSRYSMLVFLVWAVVPDLEVGLFAIRYVAMTLGSLILPTPGGAGGLEGLYALFLGPLIHPPALIAPTLLVWRTLGYYLFIALGFYLTLHTARQAVRRKGERAGEHPAP